MQKLVQSKSFSLTKFQVKNQSFNDSGLRTYRLDGLTRGWISSVVFLKKKNLLDKLQTFTTVKVLQNSFIAILKSL